ncbi:MAG: PAS domain S-box protein [Ignavibacteriaceae bacterium]|jgi:PAS domain S-box-containing protein
MSGSKSKKGNHINSNEEEVYRLKNEELIKSEQKYRQLVENSLQGVVILQDMKIVYVNPAFAHITGFTVEEILAFSPKEVGNLVHPDDWKLVWGNFRKRFAGQSIPASYHFKAISKDGSTKVLELHAQLVEFDQKPAIQGIVLDITEQIETQKALKESEEKFRSIFENSGIGKAILTPKGEFIKVNNSFAEMLGYGIEEFNNIHMVDITHPSEIEHSLQIMKELLQDKSFRYRKFEKKYLRKTGETFWGFVIITPIQDRNEKLAFFIAQLQDITKRKNGEAKLIKYAAELEELNQSKDKFFSIISHDLRSPFNALLGISEYTTKFFDKLSKEDIKESIENIHASAKKVYNLMQNLLEWTQIQTGGLEFEKSKIDLCEISKSILELYKETANSKYITLTSNISNSIFLYADLYMIETVLRNLVSNGIKFTLPRGSVSISANVKRDLVKVTVEDNGIGITPYNQKKLFSIDKQYRMDGTANEKGTGLGLILCKDFVGKSNGTINVESKLNKGSKFTFTVPLYKNSLE